MDGNENQKPIFQSTRPMRGATPYHPVVLVDHDISIHAPHAGRDPIVNQYAEEQT